MAEWRIGGLVFTGEEGDAYLDVRVDGPAPALRFDMLGFQPIVHSDSDSLYLKPRVPTDAGASAAIATDSPHSQQGDAVQPGATVSEP